MLRESTEDKLQEYMKRDQEKFESFSGAMLRDLETRLSERWEAKLDVCKKELQKEVSYQ